MLSRPPTKLSLTADDITAYEQRKAARNALRAQQENQQHQMTSSQDSNRSTVENGEDEDEDVEMTPAEQSRAARARAKREREMRILGGRSRG